MAMIKFWRGQTLPQTREADSLYFAYDGSLYLGDHLIAQVNDTNASEVNGLIAEALKAYYTKTEIDALLKSVTDAHATDKQTLEGAIADVDAKFADYNTKEAQKEKDDAQDKALTDYKAEVAETYATKEALKAVTDDYVTEAEAKSLAAAEINTIIGGVSETDTIENIKTLVEYVNENGADTTAILKELYGESADTTKDSRIDALEADIAANRDAWAANTEYTADETTLHLEGTQFSVKDVFVKKEGYFAYSEADQGRITTLEGEMDNAEGRLDAIEAKEAGWDGKQDALSEAQLAAVNSGVTADSIAAISAQADKGVNDAKAANDLAAGKTTLAEVKDTYIGNTDVKLSEVVVAVNKLSSGAEEQGASIGAINGNIDDILGMLTWNEF